MYFKGQGGNNFLFGIRKACVVLRCVVRKELFILLLRHDIVKELPKQRTNAPVNRGYYAKMLHKGHIVQKDSKELCLVDSKDNKFFLKKKKTTNQQQKTHNPFFRAFCSTPE